MRAPAKLTRRLRIVGRRPDGYHLIDAEMVTVDLYDELRFSSGDALDVVDEVGWLGPGGAPPVRAAPSSDASGRQLVEQAALPPLLGASEGVVGPNLVERALTAVGRTASVRLIKRIPTGAGLGGGSADAAAVLRWAGSSDPGVALRLGSDVPFCMSGGRARVGGVGEIVEPLLHLAARVLLVVPRVHVSTPAVYKAWDELGGPAGDRDNDLEPAALAVEPRLAWWRDLITDVSGVRPHLAGSGGTWWIGGEGDAMDDLEQAVSSAVLAKRQSAVVKLVRTLPASSAD